MLIDLSASNISSVSDSKTFISKYSYFNPIYILTVTSLGYWLFHSMLNYDIIVDNNLEFSTIIFICRNPS